MYKGLIGVDRRVLDQKESEIFIQMSMLDLQGQDKEKTDGAHQDLLARSLSYRIMVERLTQAGSIEFISRPLMFFLLTVTDRPGTAVLWAYTLNWMATQVECVNLSQWAMQFPDGLPTEPGMQAAWEAQKLQVMGIEYEFPESDNWIDNIDNWPRRERA